MIKWARDTIIALSPPIETTGAASSLKIFKQYSRQLDMSRVEFIVVARDAALIGGSVMTKTEAAILEFLHFTDAIDKILADIKKGEQVVAEIPTTAPVLQSLNKLIEAVSKI